MTICRRLSAVLLLLISFAFVHTSSAQTSIYGTVMYSTFGFTGGGYGNGTFKAGSGGPIVGVFYTFPSGSRFRAGVDGRITYGPGYNGGSAYTGALRAGFVPNRNRFRPYFQIGGGVASTQLHQTVCSGFSCGTTTTSVTNGVLHLDFGLDIRATPSLDVRAIDYGADAGAAGNSAHAGVGFISAGVVYHFSPARGRNP